ncbi:MAG: hypothetical protein COA66_09930 [Arcobacter sp.]|nr:MAG: hypothetical protein COA66_09930 [Arcobacter sp.]
MKKILLIVFTIFLSNMFLNANKTDEELIAEFMQFEKQVQKEKVKQVKLEQRQRTAKLKTESFKQLGKTVNELAKTLGVYDQK